MTVAEIIEKVEKVDKKTNYWFVRTDNGKYFDDFTLGNYIAIGWNYFTLSELEKNDVVYIKTKIANQEDFDIDKASDKTKITAAYNKIQTFLNLKKDDVIIVPSRNSDRLAFGKIEDTRAYEDKDQILGGTFFKRRKVNWYEIKDMRSLNPIFYQIKSNQHAISNIDKYAPYIDKVMENLFIKDNNTHYVLDIEKNGSINFDDLKDLMDNINSLVKNINSDLSLEENLDGLYVKINLQSKGSLELIKEAGKSLAILAYLLSMVSCNTLHDETNPKIKRLIDNNQEVLSKIAKNIDSLEINTNHLIKPFKDGY